MPRMPADLRTALEAAPSLKAAWKDLTPIARRDFISWIESAKKPETLNRRIEKTCSMLATGKRRPCCYAVVPLKFYTALAAYPKAKAQWKDLTPAERRNLIHWINSAKNPGAHQHRIEKTCLMLAAREKGS